ncbi:hypothetical protein [Streptomyces sp. H34-S4]|uniref:hypothetical protein n=1 Tax=Streptomyces sp. H34-S4 TaxID=2996463 RepID=UPI00226FC6D6|nr:hypothetical protein [Streptomyces sp. H34-S4]MCY0932822.1 hypothetical protein [Streptomyces sp. H34-S4]
MSALAVEHQPPGGDDWDSVVHLWEEMGVPEGCKVGSASSARPSPCPSRSS